MEKKYTVKEFIEHTKENKTDSIKSFIERFYVPVVDKIDTCDRIVKVTYFEKESSNLKVNSPFAKIFFDLNIIDLYTCISIDFSDKVADQFDMLKQSGMLNKLINAIPSSEIAEFKEIMDMVKEDVMTNSYETHAFVSNQITRIINVCNAIAKPMLDGLADKIEKMDNETIAKYVNKMIGILEKK